MKVYIEAAKAGGFYGPCTVLWAPGTWKDNACRMIANRWVPPPESDLGLQLDKRPWRRSLNNLAEGDILFVDEIHSGTTRWRKYCYPAMEDYRD